MEEFDLNNIWNQSEDKADDYYNSIKSELMEKAQKNSSNILDKIKRNIKLEWAISLLLGIFIILYTQNPIWISAFVIISLIIWLPYRGLLKSIKETPSQNISNALKSYIDILDKFIWRLKISTLIILPISTILGICIFVNDEMMEIFTSLEGVLLFCFVLFLVAYAAFLYWSIFAWYIPLLYGDPKKELEEILVGLNQEIT